MLATYIVDIDVQKNNINQDEVYQTYQVKLTPRFLVKDSVFGYLEGRKDDVINYLNQTDTQIDVLPDPRYASFVKD